MLSRQLHRRPFWVFLGLLGVHAHSTSCVSEGLFASSVFKAAFFADIAFRTYQSSVPVKQPLHVHSVTLLGFSYIFSQQTLPSMTHVSHGSVVIYSVLPWRLPIIP